MQQGTHVARVSLYAHVELPRGSHLQFREFAQIAVQWTWQDALACVHALSFTGHRLFDRAAVPYGQSCSTLAPGTPPSSMLLISLQHWW